MNLTPETILLIVTQISSVGAMILTNRTDIKWIKKFLEKLDQRVDKVEGK